MKNSFPLRHHPLFLVLGLSLAVFSLFLFVHLRDVVGKSIDPDAPGLKNSKETPDFPTCNACEKNQCQGTNLHLCDQPCPTPWPPVIKAWGAFRNCFVCVLGGGTNGEDICGEDMDPTPGDDNNDCSTEGQSYCANGPKFTTPSRYIDSSGLWHVITGASNSGKWVCNNNLEWEYTPCKFGLVCIMGANGATCT